MTENGFTLLAIDGTCHFWTYQSSWGQVRTGQLAPDEAGTLATKLHLESWGEWATVAHGRV
ncbi:MAG: hypothetical protein ABI205_04040 [Gemmatimonadaceae bacterium]